MDGKKKWKLLIEVVTIFKKDTGFHSLRWFLNVVHPFTNLRVRTK